jgi:hypothetical protein
MTGAKDIVTAFMLALERKDFNGAASLLSDDFYFIGSTPKPLNKNQFIQFFQELSAGIPNLSFHVHDIHDLEENEEGNRVVATIQITGHQENEINLYMLSLPVIPELGKSVSLPEEHWEYVAGSSTIAVINVEHVPEGGITELLHQLGVDAWVIQ